jgi:hypothetical protein
MAPALAVFFLLAASSIGAQEPANGPPGLIAPREFLKLFDIDPSLAAFVDGQGVDGDQRERLLAILFRVRQYPLTAVDHFSREGDALAAIAEHPAEARGQFFTVAGRVSRVERQQLDPALRERFGFDAYYRCTIATDAGPQAVMLALAVPSAWKLDAPIDERCGAKAMFVKLLPPPNGSPDEKRPKGKKFDAAGPPLLFVAGRVAWYPANTLGKLGMDFGLFDEVRDRERLDERECFYQLMAAVRRADERRLEREARENLVRSKDRWQREANDRDLDREARQAARRALASAQEETSDVVLLFNEPAIGRGQLVTLRGEALRAVEVRVDDADIASRFGIRRYYEVEIVTSGSQNNPIVCCVAQLPEGMPLGDSIRAAVRVTGFFLKSWAYSVERDDREQTRRQLAPLVIAKTLKLLPRPAERGYGTSVAVALCGALGAAAAVLWYIRRGDRRALESAREARLQLPERIDEDRLEAGG